MSKFDYKDIYIYIYIEGSGGGVHYHVGSFGRRAGVLVAAEIADSPSEIPQEHNLPEE